MIRNHRFCFVWVFFSVALHENQDVIGKQYQRWRDDFGNTIETQTFGVGSATFRNRAFLRAGVELKVIPSYSLVIESSLSAEIKAAFVTTIDKVNPVSFGVHVRVAKMNSKRDVLFL